MDTRIISYRPGKVPRIHPRMSKKQASGFLSVLQRHNPGDVHVVVPEREIVQYGASQADVTLGLIAGARKAKKIEKRALTVQVVYLIFIFFAFLSALIFYLNL